jgi:hypothetical protein
MALLGRDRTIRGRLFAMQRVQKPRLKASTEQVQHVVIRPAGRLAQVRRAGVRLLMMTCRAADDARFDPAVMDE